MIDWCRLTVLHVRCKGVVGNLDGSEHAKAIKTLKDAHEAEVKAKDTELGKKDGEIKTLKDAEITDAQIDQRVADRAELIGKAGQIVKDGDFTGKSPAQIKSMCVDAHYGEGTANDKSDDYVSGMFGAIKVANDAFAEHMQTRTPNITFDGQNGGKSESQLAYEQSLTDGWMTPAAQQ